MDGPVEQPSHTHDQTLTDQTPLCSILIAKIILVFRHIFCSLVVKLKVMRPYKRQISIDRY